LPLSCAYSFAATISLARFIVPQLALTIPTPETVPGIAAARPWIIQRCFGICEFGKIYSMPAPITLKIRKKQESLYDEI
jgi:hypothetical protein